MASGATPRQGDHVFNDLSLALLRPFDIIQSLTSPHVDGRHFIHDYLVHAHGLVKTMADAPKLSEARTLAAFAGDEENALREIAALRTRNPALARITPPFLRTIHDHNSNTFGDAGRRYDVEVLTAVQQSLQAAVAPAAPAAAASRTAAAGIACQQMIAAAYDPAAALIVITDSVSQEPTQGQPNFHRTIAAIADTLDKPAMWKDPYENFRESRPTATGKKIDLILEVLRRMDLLKAQSSAFTGMIANEIRHKATAPKAAEEYGAMLHLLHMRLQQMRS
jgi:hypothetical protein